MIANIIFLCVVLVAVAIKNYLTKRTENPSRKKLILIVTVVVVALAGGVNFYYHMGTLAESRERVREANRKVEASRLRWDGRVVTYSARLSSLFKNFGQLKASAIRAFRRSHRDAVARHKRRQWRQDLLELGNKLVGDDGKGYGRLLDASDTPTMRTDVLLIAQEHLSLDMGASPDTVLSKDEVATYRSRIQEFVDARPELIGPLDSRRHTPPTRR